MTSYRSKMNLPWLKLYWNLFWKVFLQNCHWFIGLLAILSFLRKKLTKVKSKTLTVFVHFLVYLKCDFLKEKIYYLKYSYFIMKTFAWFLDYKNELRIWTKYSVIQRDILSCKIFQISDKKFIKERFFYDYVFEILMANVI